MPERTLPEHALPEHALPSQTFARRALVTLMLLGSALSCSRSPTADVATGTTSASPGRVESNVTHDDYAGSEACTPCHQTIARTFEDSPMRRMTRHATPTAVSAPFDGTTYVFKEDRVVLESHGPLKYMRIDSTKHGSALYQVTKVIGGHYREDYVGQRVTHIGAELLDMPRDERVLPVSWLLFENAWRYKGYSVMVPERPHLAGGATWRQACIFCHNTFPVLTSLYDDFDRRAGSYQGSISDNFLPPERTWRYEVTDEAALIEAIAQEARRLDAALPTDAPLATVLRSAVRETRDRFDEQHLIELGVGCESCHNGAREHVNNPAKRTTFEPVSNFLQFVNADGERGTDAEYENRACARCHTVLFSRYQWTWEGSTRARASGGSNINSGEARDYLLGGCASQMSCSTCHDPHAGSSRQRMDELGTPKGNSVCTNCHTKYATEAASRAHSHHDPQGAGGACIGCHMPKKNMGLAYDLTRYHRIGSPNDQERVERDRPLECALCHAEDSTESLVRWMETWWGGSFDRTHLEALYGSLEARPLLATLTRGKPHEQAAAAVSLAQLSGSSAVGPLLPLLRNEIPLVRFYAREALANATGTQVDVDVEADVAQIAKEAKAWHEAWRSAAPSRTGDARSAPEERAPQD